MDLYLFSIGLIYIFILITGFHDEGNLIATVISSKSLNATKTFMVACISQFAGTMIIGDKVSKTMAFGVISSKYLINNRIDEIVAAALIGAISWNIITWHFRIPSSSSHAIVGSLMGSAFMCFGIKALNFYSILIFILLPLFSSPLVGYMIGFLLMKITNRIFEGFSVLINGFLKKVQIITLVLLNMEQGSNDAQKGLGLILILMFSKYGTDAVSLPSKMKLISAVMISAGLAIGGYRMIKSVGGIYKVKPIHSLNAQLSALFIILAASATGSPISGTQVVNSSIVGVGACERPNAVGWRYVKDMLIGWVVTIPCSFLIASLIFTAFQLLKI